MTEAAVKAATAASYRNAGTVEFLLEAQGDGAENAGPSSEPFYFLEMNTRLQVEHAVTESVVGVDLVRAQLLVASGEPLPWTTRELTQRGHAIEARVYAEDPSNGFVPQAGKLLLYREPRIPGVRVDSGVAEGSDVSVHYDPLLAKVIASAETRDYAIRRLMEALRTFPVLGIQTNIAFLLRALDHADFRAGRVDTGFLDRQVAALAGTHVAMPDFVRAAVAAHSEEPPRGAAATWDPWG
jgi:acetyl/propionyl-CoA carboxylase alpha subunit